MPITIYESFRAVFYTPFYLPHALGAYAAEGLDVELGTSPDLNAVGAHMRDGGADVYWGGPMRIMVNYDRDPECGIDCADSQSVPAGFGGYPITVTARPDIDISPPVWARLPRSRTD